MSKPEVPVNPATLLWARKRASATLEQSAKKAGVDEARIEAWEKGDEKPTVAQLRHLADLYKRPLAFFFLDEVPKDFTVMKAFRRLPDADDLKLSFDLALQLRQALQRRDIAIGLLSELGDSAEPFKLKAALSESPSEVASRIRVAVGVTLPAQQRWKDDYEALRAWRAAVERLGALVFQASGVDVDEMRGLAIFQSVYPLVLLNSKDAVRGRIFSLAHELAHLLLRTAGTRDAGSAFSDPDDDQEVWCNEFAGSFLLPTSALAWSSPERRPELFDWALLKTEANRFKVSQEVVLRRLLSAKVLSLREYQALRKELHHRTPQRSAEGGPVAQDVKVVSRLGVPFVRMVIAAHRQGKITLSDVADYLDVNVKYLHAIEERVVRANYEAEGSEA